MLPLVFSCAALPPEQISVEPEKAPPVKTPVEKPEPSKYIMGNGLVIGDKLSMFLVQNNLQVNPEFVQALALLYIEEAAIEGVNHDIAFAQMCLETGFLGFGGLVHPDWNNFCGLGAIGPEQPGLVFPDPRTGVRAHIQHLKAYASVEPLNMDLVNPRFRFIRRGNSPTIDGLAGTWATDKLYADKISNILYRLYDFSFAGY